MSYEVLIYPDSRIWWRWWWWWWWRWGWWRGYVLAGSRRGRGRAAAARAASGRARAWAQRGALGRRAVRRCAARMPAHNSAALRRTALSTLALSRGERSLSVLRAATGEHCTGYETCARGGVWAGTGPCAPAPRRGRTDRRVHFTTIMPFGDNYYFGRTIY